MRPTSIDQFEVNWNYHEINLGYFQRVCSYGFKVAIDNYGINIITNEKCYKNGNCRVKIIKREEWRIDRQSQSPIRIFVM